MTPLIIIIALLAVAAAGTWGWIRLNRSRKLAEQKAKEESERLTAETRLAHEEAMAETKARDDACLQTEAERSRQNAEVVENARLAEMQRLAAEKRAAEAETRRRAEVKELAEDRVREAAHLKAEAETKQRAEAETREKAHLAAEEKQRAEERRQAEERARAEAETRERARIAAEEEARHHAEEKLEEERTADEPVIEVPSQPIPPEENETPRPPIYQPTAPSAPTATSRTRRPTGPRTTRTSEGDLRLRVQLVFGRGGVVRSLAIAPDRRDGMPNEIKVTGTQGELHLTELRDDCYELVTLSDAGNALLQGIEWRGLGEARHWRWVSGGRELYVLAPGDEFGLHGFVSTARLWLNARHVVLATARLREEVLAALSEAGCGTPEVSDGTTSGVPSGWLLFRDVTPTRAVPMRDDRDILNSLCPAHEIEPHFFGGIRLERNTWLAEYPPRIRFTGEFANGFEVKIDGHLAHRASDGAFEAPGWNSEGEHRLWFGDRAETYSLCTMEEGWSHWHAHDLGMGAAICGASTHPIADARWQQVCIPVANPVLLGAQPGEIVRCHIRRDSCSENTLVQIPFRPVWAMPANPARADKRPARILLLNSIGPIPCVDQTNRKRLVRQWAAAIGNAGRAQLALATESEQAKTLWRSYRVVAKRLRRKNQ